LNDPDPVPFQTIRKLQPPPLAAKVSEPFPDKLTPPLVEVPVRDPAVVPPEQAFAVIEVVLGALKTGWA
jgi:hypothetical protein